MKSIFKKSWWTAAAHVDLLWEGVPLDATSNPGSFPVLIRVGALYSGMEEGSHQAAHVSNRTAGVGRRLCVRNWSRQHRQLSANKSFTTLRMSAFFLGNLEVRWLGDSA